MKRTELARLCEDAALPSPQRHAHAEALLELLRGKELQGMLDRARAEGATASDLQHGIAAALAIDALSERRPVPAIERQRVEELVARLVTRDDLEPWRHALGLAARARVRLHVGEAENALADLDAATALLASVESTAATHAFVASRRGYALSMLARTEESLAAHALSAEHAKATGDVRAYVAAMQDEGNLLQQLGRDADALERFQQSLGQARAVEDVAGEMRAHAGIAYHHVQALEFDAAQAEYAAALAIGETGVAPRLKALVMGYSAMLHLEHDRVERAIALAARAVAESAKLGFRIGEGFFAAVQAAAHARTGDLEAADDRLRFATGRVPADHAYVDVVRLFEAQVAASRAALLARAGAHAEAEQQRAAAHAVLADVSRPRAGEARALVDRLDDARVAARMLHARLVPGAPTSAPGPPDEDTDALARRLDTRRLLSLLRARPGKSVGPQELAAHVWPGDALDAIAARLRLDALVTAVPNVRFEDDGYLLSLVPDPHHAR